MQRARLNDARTPSLGRELLRCTKQPRGSLFFPTPTGEETEMESRDPLTV